jgi:uncharacterized membrane protein
MPNVISESKVLDKRSRHPWLWGLVGFLTLIGNVVVGTTLLHPHEPER